MKKLLAILLSTLMLLALLAPMSSLAQDKYELTFWVYSDWKGGKQAELLNRWADEFVASHDNVKAITMIGKNDNDLLTGMMAGVGLPDCVSASFRDGTKYYEAIDLLDLKPYFDAMDDQYKNGWIPEAIAAVEIDGGMWALPYMSYIPLLYRNLDVLEQAGIDPAAGIPTWADFIEQCKTIKEAGLNSTHKWSGDWYTAGGILASEPTLTPGNVGGKTTVTAEQMLRTFQIIADLAQYTTTTAYSDESAREAFKTNKLAFMADGPWNVEGYDESGVRYDIVPFPAMEKGGKNGGMSGWDAVYAIDSGNETKNALIAEWLLFITNTENQTEWVSYVGRPVLRQDAMAAPSAQLLEVAKVSGAAQLGGMAQMDYFRSNVFWPSAIADVSENVALGSITPEEGAAKMVEAINNLFAEAGE